ncbi:MAG TPA: phosphate signaling complex protein PhoU [Candidatus Limnocylindrales bacterium]|jgi:phosphate transport system protein|nr:phosphate signaling complex protein PhoU [Candidatus Limnocylindrales bacterium]
MSHFEQELHELKNLLLTMASHAEAAVKQAVKALINRDYDLAQRVHADDAVIDRFEIELDEMAIHLLAKAPLASDLRLIAVAMKISQNLERVGDEGTKIAKRARDLSQEPPLKLNLEIPQLADLALGMLKQALDSFVANDAPAARALIPQDKQVDSLNRKIHDEVAAHMMQHPETVTRCLHLLVVAKSLERVADHAKNVAEEVVYLCEAEDIRHSGAPKTDASRS